MITRVRIFFQYWPLLQQLLLSFVTNLYNCVRLQSIHRCKHIQSIQRCLNKFHSSDSHGFHFCTHQHLWDVNENLINFEWAALRFNKVIHRFQQKMEVLRRRGFLALKKWNNDGREKQKKRFPKARFTGLFLAQHLRQWKLVVFSTIFTFWGGDYSLYTCFSTFVCSSLLIFIIR